jgi:hypothetical protein
MIDPPPCFTVPYICELDWPSQTQHQDRPSELKRLILLSSEKMTLSQSLRIQCQCLFAKSRGSLMYYCISFGFFYFTLYDNPARLKVLRTVQPLTFTPLLCLRYLTTVAALS